MAGLAEYGKGDWRSISRNYVLTRTPTQVHTFSWHHNNISDFQILILRFVNFIKRTYSFSIDAPLQCRWPAMRSSTSSTRKAHPKPATAKLVV